jgi:hypothetical protein
VGGMASVCELARKNHIALLCRQNLVRAGRRRDRSLPKALPTATALVRIFMRSSGGAAQKNGVKSLISGSPHENDAQARISAWPVKHHAIGIFSWAKASFTAIERSLRS